jgi:hypothetical protein
VAVVVVMVVVVAGGVVEPAEAWVGKANDRRGGGRDRGRKGVSRSDALGKVGGRSRWRRREEGRKGTREGRRKGFVGFRPQRGAWRRYGGGGAWRTRRGKIPCC